MDDPFNVVCIMLFYMKLLTHALRENGCFDGVYTPSSPKSCVETEPVESRAWPNFRGLMSSSMEPGDSKGSHSVRVSPSSIAQRKYHVCIGNSLEFEDHISISVCR